MRTVLGMVLLLMVAACSSVTSSELATDAGGGAGGQLSPSWGEIVAVVVATTMSQAPPG